MFVKQILIVISMLGFAFLSACSSTEFMGAQKWVSARGFYIERWFLQPDDKFKQPEGTAFYGAAAEKVKHHYIVKYYMDDPGGGPDATEIPAEDMWHVKHNGKTYRQQDDDDLFFYIKTQSGQFKKHKFAIDRDVLMPIKTCYDDGWCELYPTSYPETFYVRRSILYKE